MSHGYHESQPGYSPEQILHDGCDECTYRSENPSRGLASLDPANFARAWYRAHEFNMGRLGDVSRTEKPLLDILWAIQLQLERRGIPIGVLPVPAIFMAGTYLTDGAS